MLADSKSGATADPAFEAHVGVLHMWALAVWEDWVPRAMSQWLISHAGGRIDRAKRHWSVVYGPAAAVLATDRRSLCSAVSLFHWITDGGVEVDLRVDYPAFLHGLVKESVGHWRWHRIESNHCTSDSVVLQTRRGAARQPILKVLGSKKCEGFRGWTERHLALSFLLQAEAQQRFFQVGLVPDGRRRLCLDMPGGGQAGMLLHRLVCPTLVCLREKYMSLD